MDHGYVKPCTARGAQLGNIPLWEGNRPLDSLWSQSMLKYLSGKTVKYCRLLDRHHELGFIFTDLEDTTALSCVGACVEGKCIDVFDTHYEGLAKIRLRRSVEDACWHLTMTRASLLVLLQECPGPDHNCGDLIPEGYQRHDFGSYKRLQSGTRAISLAKTTTGDDTFWRTEVEKAGN